jgi:hypothetical protein
MDKTSSKYLFERAKRHRVVGFILLVPQLIRYLLYGKSLFLINDTRNTSSFITDHLFTVIAIALLIRSTFLKRQAKLAAQKEEIERIGL